MLVADSCFSCEVYYIFLLFLLFLIQSLFPLHYRLSRDLFLLLTHNINMQSTHIVIIIPFKEAQMIYLSVCGYVRLLVRQNHFTYRHKFQCGDASSMSLVVKGHRSRNQVIKIDFEQLIPEGHRSSPHYNTHCLRPTIYLMKVVH